MKTTITEAQKFIRHGIHGAKLGRTILKSSLVAASLAVLGTSAGLANENPQGSESPAVSGQIDNRGVSQASSAPAGEVAAQRKEAKTALVAYVPSYRTGLKWKN